MCPPPCRADRLWGHVESVTFNGNFIEDPDTRAYYTAIRTVTRAPLVQAPVQADRQTQSGLLRPALARRDIKSDNPDVGLGARGASIVMGVVGLCHGQAIGAGVGAALGLGVYFMTSRRRTDAGPGSATQPSV